MTKLIMSNWHKKQLTLQRNGYAPEESCAILLGRGNKVENICPIENLSPRGQFLMEPQSQGNLIMAFIKDKAPARIVAYYHSHPPGCEGRPSSVDLDEARRGWYKGTHLIHGSDGIRAWDWDGEQFTEIGVEYCD